MIGIIGKKIGMTRIFNKEGESIPITIIKIEDNKIIQIKNKKKEGYNAVQLTTGIKKKKRVKKSEIGHFLKAKQKVGKILHEFKIKNKKKYIEGQIIDIKCLSKIKKIKVTNYSKGKGFSGTIKRWNFRTQDASHGNSLSHRAPGSIGQNQSPGKVFKGKKMAGQMGNKKVTIKKLKIIFLDYKKNLLVIKGSVPGFVNSHLIIQSDDSKN